MNYIIKTLTCYLIVTLIIASQISTANANDKSQQVDLVYSKLVSALPTQGTLMMRPYAEYLNAYGDNQKNILNNNSDAIGGSALELDVRKGRNTWDAGVVSPIATEIKKGDTIYITIFAKAITLPKGKQSSTLTNVGIQRASEPYDSILARDLELTKQWQTYSITTKSKKNFDVGEAQLSIQLATDDHKIAFGPAFVINLGQNVDYSALPYLYKQP